MKCPHCLEAFHDTWTVLQTHTGTNDFEDPDGNWQVRYTTCPTCKRLVVKLFHRSPGREPEEAIVRPKVASRAPLSPHVPEVYANDYREACLVLADSPKASAALSRRCLQAVIRDQFQVKKASLSDEIDELLNSAKLPSYISEAVDAIRNYGNFSAHPLKSTSTGEIMDVEPGEAEWCLEVLESLFDFCFVQPAQLSEKRAALDKKLAEAGKPAMK